MASFDAPKQAKKQPIREDAVGFGSYLFVLGFSVDESKWLIWLLRFHLFGDTERGAEERKNSRGKTVKEFEVWRSVWLLELKIEDDRWAWEFTIDEHEL